MFDPIASADTAARISHAAAGVWPKCAHLSYADKPETGCAADKNTAYQFAVIDGPSRFSQVKWWAAGDSNPEPMD
jgi:hypothetical protein